MSYLVTISKFSQIGSFNSLKNCQFFGGSVSNSNILKSQVSGEVNNSVIVNSTVKNAKVGVFSYLRPKTKVLKNAKIGSFVELKKCVIGKNSKVPHLSYVGDAEIGENVNIGCGVVFCNYNGVLKQKTIVGNNCFVGANSNLVAPLTLRDNCFVAAGSTITADVPTKALAIARARQINKQNYLK